MPEALRIIHAEHENLAAVYRCLQAVINDVEAGRLEPDFEFFDAVFDYVAEFLNRYHHPKENDYLFAALRRRRPDMEGKLARLEKQHRECGPALESVHMALDAWRETGPDAFPAFRDATERLIRFETQHMQEEEGEVIPVARAELGADDWQAIDAAFLDNDDPVFGEEPRRRFHHLFTRLMDMLPPRYGAGSIPPA